MKVCLSLILLLLASNLHADTFNLAWDAVTTDSNGNPPTSPLVSYKVYVSTSPIKATWPTTIAPYATIPAGTTTKTVTQSTLGKYYAVVSATNAIGESGPSNEVTFDVVSKPPGTPQSLRLVIP
jgi:hypothetical protein